MGALRTLPVVARFYILAVSSAAVVCAIPVVTGRTAIDWPKLLVLAVLFAVCERISRCPLKGRYTPSGTGSSYSVVLAAVMMLPPSCAALVVLPGALAVPREPRLGQPAPAVRRPPSAPGGRSGRVHRLWQAAQLAVSAAFASQAYRWLGGPRSLDALHFPLALLHALLAALVFCLVTTVFISGMLVATGRSGVRAALRGVLPSLLAPCLACGMVGLAAAVLWRQPYGPSAVVLALLPMYVSCWMFAQYHRERAVHHATVRALVQAVNLKDEYTRGHSERVGRASVMIGREMGMSEERLGVLRFAGVLHDVGKLGVPTRVLRKPGRLTAEERRVIQLHPEYGHEMVRGIAFLGEARAAILYHHERLDGRGYPCGLAGGQIPEFARVVAVADAFDAMTSTRSYRAARPVAAAVEELERGAGSQFDPRMVRALARAVRSHGWGTTADARGAGGAAVARAVRESGPADIQVSAARSGTS